MVHTNQTAARFASYHSIFPSGYGSYVATMDHRITIGTPFRLADTMPPKRKQEQSNPGKYQQNIQYMQPSMKDDSNHDKTKGKKIPYPKGLFHIAPPFQTWFFDL